MPRTNTIFQDYIAITSDVRDCPEEGPVYRCAVQLKDGTDLPCVVLQHAKPRLERAARRLKETSRKRGLLGGWEFDTQILDVFVSAGTRIDSYNVAKVTHSPYSVPRELLKQIRGETFMSWTAWVFEMRDGKLFNYGCAWDRSFLNLPEDYGFKDVQKVHNNSYACASGEIVDVYGNPGKYLELRDKEGQQIYESRVYFQCYLADE